MSIVQIVLLAVVGALLLMAIREVAPQVSFVLSLFLSAVLLLAALGKVTGLLTPLARLAAEADVNILFFATVLKVIGIAYLAEFGAQVARDAGAGSVAAKVELFGKLSIIVLAIPILTTVVDTVQHLLP